MEPDAYVLTKSSIALLWHQLNRASNAVHKAQNALHALEQTYLQFVDDSEPIEAPCIKECRRMAWQVDQPPP